MRAAGFWAGLLTALLDIFKGASAVIIARQLPSFQEPWLLIVIPLLVIIGHNYSVFMLSKETSGKLLLIGILVFYFIGYASVTTMSIALSSTFIFSLRAVNIDASWAYAVYGLIAEILLVISLRPNIQRLKEGTERLHGFRARKLKALKELKN
jgi:glycerol-3-phosphate acyltransferase PlsY